MLESLIVLSLGFNLASVAYLVRDKDLLGEFPWCSEVVHTWDVPAKKKLCLNISKLQKSSKMQKCSIESVSSLFLAPVVNKGLNPWQSKSLGGVNPVQPGRGKIQHSFFGF